MDELAQCSQCFHHFQVDPRGDIQGAACPDCGGTRMLRGELTGVSPEGTLRDMVDSDTQKDQGGNPLGEGTIMGEDGEVAYDTGSRGRDNYMHGSVLAALMEGDEPVPIDERFDHWIRSKGDDPNDPVARAQHLPAYEKQRREWDEAAAQKATGMGMAPEVHDWAHPDPWMDNEPGTLTYPEHWGSILAALVTGEYYPGESGHEQEIHPTDNPATCPMCKHQSIIPETGECLTPNCGYVVPWDGMEWHSLPGAEKFINPNWLNWDSDHWLNPQEFHGELGPVHQGKKASIEESLVPGIFLKSEWSPNGTTATPCKAEGGPLTQAEWEHYRQGHSGWSGQHFPPSDREPVDQPQHPDPWMDNEPGTTTFPENWLAAILAAGHPTSDFPEMSCPNCGGKSLFSERWKDPDGGVQCLNCGHQTAIPWDEPPIYMYDRENYIAPVDFKHMDPRDFQYEKLVEPPAEGFGPKRVGKTADVEGRTNWDTNYVKLQMDDDRPLQEESRLLHEKGWTPEQIRDWAIQKIIGPENKNKIQDAQEYNEKPEEERRDPHWEEFIKPHPELHEAIPPDLSDYDPSNHMIDPELVNWNEIWQELEDERDEDRKYEEEDKRLQNAGLTFHMPGHKDETNRMLDAWLKHHGVTERDQRLEGGGSAEHHTKMQVPIEHLPMDEGEYTPEEYAQWQQRGYGEPRVRSFGWDTLHDIQRAKANPWQNKTMRAALTGQGYTPQEIEQIMKPQFEQYQNPQYVNDMNPEGNAWRPIQPYVKPEVPDNQPGDLTMPEGWTAAQHIAANPPVNSREMPAFERFTRNMEPYESLFHEAAFLLPDAVAPVAEAIGGANMLKDVPVVGGLMNKALGMGGEQQQQAPQYQSPLAPEASVLDAFFSDYETPASNPDVGVKHDDPEEVDQKEFNDQDKSPENLMNPNDEDSGPHGSTTGEDGVKQQEGMENPMGEQFGEGSQGLERMNMLMPLVLHYFHSEEPGHHDPMLKGLHEMLEAEMPGYLDKGDDRAAEEFIKSMKQPHDVHAAVKEAIVPPIPGITDQVGPAPMGINPMEQAQLKPSTQGQPMVSTPPPSSATPPGAGFQSGHCPGCGGVMGADGSCPQCGMRGSTPGQMPPAAALQTFGANHQGPVTPEQQAAVIEKLEASGRSDLIQGVVLDPGNPIYVKILAEITNDNEVAPPVTQEEQTQVQGPPPQMAPPGGMPMPGMGGEPGGQPMAPMSSFLPDFTAFEDKLAADNIAKRCPKCNSATTGMMGDTENHAHCHSCGNIFKENLFDDMDMGNTAVAASVLALVTDEKINPPGVPAAQQEHPLNQGGDEDSSLTWKDTEERPIQANQEYMMHSPQYPIPDMVRVLRVKPDGLEVMLLGTYANEPEALQTPEHISKEELEMNKLQFEPANQNADQRGEPEPPPGRQTPGEETVPPSGATTDEQQATYPQYNSSVCPRCGHAEKYSYMISPETTEHNCYRCGHDWTTKEEVTGLESNLASRDWLHEANDDDEFNERLAAMARAKVQSRDLGSIAQKDPRLQAIRDRLGDNQQQRLAGKHFSPGEQRTLIDEDGVARNADLLDLAGTHYKSSLEAQRANGDNVPDEHILFGLL